MASASPASVSGEGHTRPRLGWVGLGWGWGSGVNRMIFGVVGGGGLLK